MDFIMLKKNPVEKTTVYKMKYLKEEIIRILADRRKVVNANKTLQQTLF